MEIYCGLCGAPRELHEDDLKRKLRCDFCRAQVPVPIRMPTSPEIRLYCPECEARLKTPLDRSGKKFRCPFCKAPVALVDIRDESEKSTTPSKTDTDPVITHAQETQAAPDSPDDEPTEVADSGKGLALENAPPETPSKSRSLPH